MNKKLLTFVAVLITIVGISVFVFIRIDISSKLNGNKVVKIDVKELRTARTGGVPFTLMTLTDEKSIGTVLVAINRAEKESMPRIPTYNQAGTSTHVLEIYNKDKSKEIVYIALGPHNQSTVCVKDNEPLRYMIDEKDTRDLRALILKIK